VRQLRNKESIAKKAGFAAPIRVARFSPNLLQSYERCAIILLASRANPKRAPVIGKFHKNVAVGLVCCCALLVLMTHHAGAKDPVRFKPFGLKTLDGEKKTLADFSKKATLVGFFYPRCPFCNLAIPKIQSLYDAYKDRGLSVVLINVVPDENKLIPKWLEQYHLTLPVLIGASQESLARSYDLRSTPTEYLLGPNGEVLFFHSGYAPGDERALEAKIAEALGKTQDKAAPETP
jgi:peroxiredoxin